MKKTAFQPQQNGFAFLNAWTFDPDEARRLVEALDVALRAMSPLSLGTVHPAIAGLITPMLESWLARAVPTSYGLCGGMACAALDYYAEQLPTPRGKGIADLPTAATPEGRTLRRYIFDRQIASMVLNYPKLFIWMAILHIDLPFFLDGPQWLLEQTRQEWVALKQRIDSDRPQPLMLIGSSTNPFDNHQVLAYGYDDPGDGTATMYIYDMNCPDRENTIRCDFRGFALQAEESCPSAPRGPLRGFFCNQYELTQPPRVSF